MLLLAGTQTEEGRWQQHASIVQNEQKTREGKKEQRKKKETCELEIQSSLTPLVLWFGLFTMIAFLLYSMVMSMNIATANSLL